MRRARGPYPLARSAVAAALVAASAVALPARAAAQADARGRPVRLVAFTNEPREPAFGDVFPLSLQLRVAPDAVAFLPDTLIPAENAVSAGRAEWTTTPGPADSIDVRVAYPVMGLLPGGVVLPALEVWARPAEAGEPAGPRRLSDLPGAAIGGEPPDGFLSWTIDIGGVLIMLPEEMTGGNEGLVIDPAVGVFGGETSVWRVALIAVLALAAAVLARLLLVGRPPASSAESAVAPLTAKEEALRELDRIHGLGWHRNGRVVDFYEATTDVLRRFEEGSAAHLPRSLTSSELMDRMAARRSQGEVEDLRSAVWAAECAKFAGRTSGSVEAESHWSAVRRWIERVGEG